MASSDGYSKCVCPHCGGHIEFPSAGEGRTVPCPHCQWPTVLAANAPATMISIGGGAAARRPIFQTFLVAAIVVVAAGAGVYWHWQRPKGEPPAASAASQPGPASIAIPKPAAPVVAVPVAPPDPWHGLMGGPISLEKAGDGRLVYAVGKLRNASDHQRFGVKVELDVFDAGNKKVGTATDYTPTIDPGKEWKFRALVIDRAAATAKLASVKED